jgi:DNA ligase (NAD+)
VVTKKGKVAKPPTKCPTCKAALDKIGEYLACRNRLCRALIEGRIENWIDAIGALDWGDRMIAQLVEAKLVEEPADLYTLKPEQIAGLERRGLVIANKVLENLRAQLPLSLPKFLAALGIESFGLQTAKAIVAAGFDSLEKVQSAPLAELAALPGVGPSKARAVVEGLKERKAEIARLIKVGVVPVNRANAGPLAGKTFCFTGALARPRKELEQLVEGLGGTLLSGVTKELKYLVMADPQSGSSKSQKAKQYGTECLDEAGFLAVVEAAKGAGVVVVAAAVATAAAAKPAATKPAAAKPAATKPAATKPVKAAKPSKPAKPTKVATPVKRNSGKRA